MTLLGIDISHHQGSFDVERAAREGIEFFIFKATEGSGFTDARFAENLVKARKTGKPFAAYHYQRQGISAAAQVAQIRRVVPKDVPVILDVEANSGHVSLTRDIIARLRKVGYRSPLLYLPRWYWQQIGSPSLTGLPPLWSSRYPDNVVGGIRDEYAQVPPHYWNGYGGLPVAVLQFTSSARVAGRSPIDGNAYRGTLAEFRALLGGSPGGGAAAPSAPAPIPIYQQEEFRMELKPGKHGAYMGRIPPGAGKIVVGCPHGSMKARVMFHGPTYPSTHKMQKNVPDFDWSGDESHNGIDRMRPWVLKIPKGATGATVYWDYPPPAGNYETYTASVTYEFEE